MVSQNCESKNDVEDYKWEKDGTLQDKNKEYPAITQLNDKIFRDFMNYNDYVFIMFYAEWCPHSRQFMPFFQKLKKEWDTKNAQGELPYKVKFVKIKGDTYPEISDSFEVENFPSFRFIIKVRKKTVFPH
jgi:thiol-disulfide isomerase/thioredoxin